VDDALNLWVTVKGKRGEHFWNKNYRDGLYYDLAKAVSLSEGDFGGLNWATLEADESKVDKGNGAGLQSLASDGRLMLKSITNESANLSPAASTLVSNIEGRIERLFLASTNGQLENLEAKKLERSKIEEQIELVGKQIEDLQAAKELREQGAKTTYQQTRDTYRAATNSLAKATIAFENAVKASEALVDPDRPPADMLLLINPASEAIPAYMMTQALRENELIWLKNRATNSVHPWLISVSSHGETPWGNNGDWLTDKLFPFGRWFSALKTRFRSDLDQRNLFLHTAPQTDMMCNHEVKGIDLPSGVANPLYGETDFSRIVQVNTSLSRTDPVFYSTNSPEKILRIVSRAGSENDSSYWIFSVDKSIIPKHGNIFTPNIVALAAGLFRISQAGNGAVIDPAQKAEIAH
jgi:hypothetical protein